MGLLRRANEEAYVSAVGKPQVDADDEELMKPRSSLRRSRNDGVNLPNARDAAIGRVEYVEGTAA